MNILLVRIDNSNYPPISSTMFPARFETTICYNSRLEDFFFKLKNFVRFFSKNSIHTLISGSEDVVLGGFPLNNPLLFGPGLQFHEKKNWVCHATIFGGKIQIIILPDQSVIFWILIWFSRILIHTKSISVSSIISGDKFFGRRTNINSYKFTKKKLHFVQICFGGIISNKSN